MVTSFIKIHFLLAFETTWSEKRHFYAIEDHSVYEQAGGLQKVKVCVRHSQLFCPYRSIRFDLWSFFAMVSGSLADQNTLAGEDAS